MLAVALLACSSTSCPSGWSSDPERSARVVALAGQQASGPLCYGPVQEGGVRDGSDRLLLDAGADDRWLAARVVHLALHGPAVLGVGCVDGLRLQEATAWRAELDARLRLGVSDPSCPVESALGPSPSIEALRLWIDSSPHPRAHGLRRSHNRRCSG